MATPAARKKWTPRELENLHNWAGVISIEDICGRLDRSYSSVYNTARKRGLRLTLNKNATGYSKWSDVDELKLETWAGHIPVKVIAEIMGRSKSSVSCKAEKMGLSTQVWSWNYRTPFEWPSNIPKEFK